MDGILNTGIEFWQLLVGFVVAVLGAVVIRITFSFDVNRFLEDRRKMYDAKLKNVCTHLRYEVVDDKITYRFLFESPPGMYGYYCTRCGLTINNPENFEKSAEYYAKNFKEYQRKEKLFKKYSKKAGL